MSSITLDEEFKKYLLSAYSLDENELNRLLDDLLGSFNNSLDSYIQKRHSLLQKEGKKNSEIYEILQQEILTQPFLGPELTIRQIRRVIYG